MSNIGLAVTTVVLPTGAVGSWYQAQLETNGFGLPPYSWGIADGSLPKGLALSPDGFISGTPTQVLNSRFTTFVHDAAAVQVSAVIWCHVIPAVLPDPSNPNEQFIQQDFVNESA